MKKLIFLRPFCKRLFVIMFVGLLYPNISNGQEESGSSGELNYGIKFGTTVSSFGNTQPHTNLKQGITGGVFANYYFSSSLAVQIEFNYLEQGGRLTSFEVPDLLSDDSWFILKANNNNLIFSTLDMPLLLKYSIPLGSAKLSVDIGPTIGYNIATTLKNETTVFTNSGSFNTYTGESDISSRTEDWNFAGTVGLGFELPVLDFSLFLDARYRYGYTPLYKSYSYMGIPQIAGDLYSNTWYLTIGFGF